MIHRFGAFASADHSLPHAFRAMLMQAKLSFAGQQNA
jgi:hypothetical protein